MEKREIAPHLYLIKYKMKYEIDTLMELGKTYKTNIQTLVFNKKPYFNKVFLLFEQNSKL